MVLGLNEDLAVGKGQTRFATVILNDCNFHDCVNYAGKPRRGEGLGLGLWGAGFE